MLEAFDDRHRPLTRRQFMLLMSATAGGSLLQGCATSPVTGQQILVGMSEEAEVAADRSAAPHQFSQDLGAVQDDSVNQYVVGVANVMQAKTHRPNMPYNYRVLNANYVNAYTFPGGSMGLTRAIMLQMQDEAQLAALLGHEMGHVNARHAAQRQGQAMVAQVAVATVAIAADSRYGGGAGALAGIAGQVGASALLSSYSRDNEREADALGMEYMSRVGHDPQGMVRLMQMLDTQHKEKPGLLTTMFSSHPMSNERLSNMDQLARSKYAKLSGQGHVGRERYMDNTASIRRLKPTIENCQRGELAASKGGLPEAEQHLGSALAAAPRDYAANVLMGKVLLAQKRHGDAQRYLDTAKAVYPSEAQAHKLSGVNNLSARRSQLAVADFYAAERTLPGDPGLGFLRGAAFEQMQNRDAAAREYRQFLQRVQSGGNANYAATRLKEWGYR